MEICGYEKAKHNGHIEKTKMTQYVLKRQMETRLTHIYFVELEDLEQYIKERLEYERRKNTL